MTNEELQKMKDALEIGRDAAHELAWKFHDEYRGYREAEHRQVDDNVALLEEAMAIAERATQPAQDQPAAVRAVPEGWKLVPRKLTEEQSREIVYNINRKYTGNPMSDYLAREVWSWGIHAAPTATVTEPVPAVPHECHHNKIHDRVTTAWINGWNDCRATMLGEINDDPTNFAAPSPQPELSGSIDGPEFREKLQAHLLQYQRTMGLQGDKRAEFIAHIDAWKDAACAVAAEEARRDVHETNVTCVNNMLKAQQRATDAEAKLAAIQSQVAGDAQDAARYRWLKLQARIDERDGGYHKAYCLPHIEKESGTIGGKLLYHADFDSAVDAAMREQQP